jgi:hypothetical protein
MALLPAAKPTPMRRIPLGADRLIVDLCIFYAPLVTTSLLMPLALMVGVGIPAAALVSSAMTLIQTRVDDRWRGRVHLPGNAIELAPPPERAVPR